MSDIKINIKKLVIHNMEIEGKTSITDPLRTIDFGGQEEEEEEEEENKESTEKEEGSRKPKGSKFVSIALPDDINAEELIERIEKETGEEIPKETKEGIRNFVSQVGKTPKEEGNLLDLLEENAVHTAFHLVDDAADFQAVCSLLVCKVNPLRAWTTRAVHTAKVDPASVYTFNTEIGLFCAALILDSDKDGSAAIGSLTKKVIENNPGITDRVKEILKRERGRKEKPNRNSGVDTTAL